MLDTFPIPEICLNKLSETEEKQPFKIQNSFKI
jgi:hypothetical protein